MNMLKGIKINLFRRKIIFATFALFVLSLVAVFLSWFFLFGKNKNITSDVDLKNSVGEMAKEDFLKTPALALAEKENGWEIFDDGKTGIEITNPHEVKSEIPAEEKKELKVFLPNDYEKPIEVKLDAERTISISDSHGKGFSSQAISSGFPTSEEKIFDQLKRNNQESHFLKYKKRRKAVYYAYQRDVALDRRQLKHWTVYAEPDVSQAGEKEEYVFQNAKLKINQQGEAEVFYFGQKEIQNQQVIEEVDPSLLERAREFLKKELGGDILNDNRAPDFVIPEPYYLDKNGQKRILKWKINEEKNSLWLEFKPAKEDYPIALDPTLYFSFTNRLVVTGRGFFRRGK